MNCGGGRQLFVRFVYFISCALVATGTPVCNLSWALHSPSQLSIGLRPCCVRTGKLQKFPTLDARSAYRFTPRRNCNKS